MFIHSVHLLYKDIKITDMAHNNNRDIPFFEWLPKSITILFLFSLTFTLFRVKYMIIYDLLITMYYYDYNFSQRMCSS
jgi:hypothetical protein